MQGIRLPREDLAWAAGFFDGEGHVSCPNPQKGRMLLSVGQTDTRPLERLQQLFGVGAIYGPFTKDRRKPYWQWSIQNFEEVQYVIAAMWPWLTVKKEQATLALTTLANKPRRPPPPAAGEPCRKGHDTSRRKDYGDGYLHCLECARIRTNASYQRRKALK